jgi:hypothetical protein
VAVEATPHEGLDPPEVVVHRALAIGADACRPQHALELVLDVLVPHEPPSVDVEVARRDRCRPAPDPGELPDGGFGEDSHSTSRSRSAW